MKRALCRWIDDRSHPTRKLDSKFPSACTLGKVYRPRKWHTATPRIINKLLTLSTVFPKPPTLFDSSSLFSRSLFSFRGEMGVVSARRYVDTVCVSNWLGFWGSQFVVSSRVYSWLSKWYGNYSWTPGSPFTRHCSTKLTFIWFFNTFYLL